MNRTRQEVEEASPCFGAYGRDNWDKGDEGHVTDGGQKPDDSVWVKGRERQFAEQKAKSRSSSKQQESRPGEVPCDVCTGTKLKALKSCLVCLVSYCETHLEPHLTVSRLKRHQLINPVENLEDRMCVKHDKPLELFCRTDQTKLNELITTIEEKQRSTKKQAEDAIREMEREISNLMKRSTEVEKLSLSEDHLDLLQSFQSLNIHHPPPTKDWSQVSVPPASYEGTVRRAVSQLEGTLSRNMKKLVSEVELKRVQNFAVDVTLDPKTAHHELIVSDDGKQSFSSGRFYFEVKVKEKTKWTLGVTEESINRKGDVTLSPEDGNWTVRLSNGNEYEALDDLPVLLSLKSRPQKVGVFVDYEVGLVSFYDVKTVFTRFVFKIIHTDSQIKGTIGAVDIYNHISGTPRHIRSSAMVDLSGNGAVSPGPIRHGQGSGNNGKKTSKKSRARRGKRGRKRRNKKNNRNIKTPPPFFPPEAEEGNIEYKLKLVNPTQYRFEHLATQLKWRLQEGRGEAVYQIGVEDNGLLVGLTEADMKASLRTLKRMAEK
ncbi:GTP-binding protein 2 [Liparis tanakae]|uniref:GTP-binding protein 2 n=1 Tax=Liparis tanakae TaxID=230148 RepID=A0A4Z2F7B3_9TELE|nr:GTP-binding protein 2 [Liparis tanakae]